MNLDGDDVANEERFFSAAFSKNRRANMDEITACMLAVASTSVFWGEDVVSQPRPRQRRRITAGNTMFLMESLLSVVMMFMDMEGERTVWVLPRSKFYVSGTIGAGWRGEEWLEHMRMPKSEFVWLLHELGEDLTGSYCGFRNDVVPADVRLFMGLHRMFHTRFRFRV